MFLSLAAKSPLIWLTTNCESQLSNNHFTCTFFMSLRPTSKASYFTAFLEALKSNLMAQLSRHPSGLTRTIPTLEPVSPEKPPISLVCLMSSISVTLTSKIGLSVPVCCQPKSMASTLWKQSSGTK